MKDLDNLWETSNMDQADSFKPEGEDLWSGNEAYAEQLVKNGNLPPGSFEHQNLGHNAKKEGLGPNTKR